MILGHQYYSSRAPVLSFRENKDWGHSFLGTEALFAFFPAFPCLYLGIETLFAFFVWPGHVSVGRKREISYSDRPLLYENQSDLPPNLYSLEKTRARDEQYLTSL